MPSKSGWRNAALLLGASVAGIAAGLAVERTVVGRMRDRPDPEAGEPLGSLRGRSIGPVTSFDGTELNVEESGTGPTVVLSHGYLLETRAWHYQIRDLSPEYRLVMYDHRGHGRSQPAKSGDWSLDALTKDLKAVVDASGAERVALVGHSMGGMVVMKFCELYPETVRERVAGLVLVDTTAADAVGEGMPWIPRRVRAAAQGVQEAAVRAIVALDRPTVERMRRRASDVGWLAVRHSGFGLNPSPKLVAFVEKMLADTPTETWMELLPAVVGVDMVETLAAITPPTLVVVGTNDRLTPPGAAERIAKAIPAARLGRIAGAGHSPFLEAPHTFNARLATFLDSLDWSQSKGQATLDGPAAAS